MVSTVTTNNDIKYELVAEAGVESPAEPPLCTLRRTLRGRYRLVALVAVLLALVGGLVGYNVVSPIYRSTALVRIEGALPKILYESQENKIPPMFEAYVAAQVMYLQSRQVLDSAAASQEMIQAGWPAGPKGIAELQKALSVRRGRGEQVASVSVSYPDPFLAFTAVNAVLIAFEENWADPGGLSASAKQRTLTQRQAGLEQQLQQLRQEIVQVSDRYGYQAIERMHASKVEELLAIDQRLAELRLAQADLELGGSGASFTPEGSLTVGSSHLRLSDLEEQELALLAELKNAQSKYYAGHPILRKLTRQLEAVHTLKDLRERVLVSRASEAGGGAGNQSPTARGSSDRLVRLEESYQSMRTQIREETADLARQRDVLGGLNEQVSEVKRLLGETRRRLDELRVEANRDSMNRISIAAYGDFPVASAYDRRPGLAIAGTLFGSVAGISLVVVIGILDPRVRFVEELEALNGSAPIIGVLPELKDGDEAGQHRAAQRVHQIRNLLELRCGNDGTIIYAVTSCAEGEGNTSLALALACSFAAAGRKTLVIDADMVRGGLTSELGLRDDVGLCECIGPDNGSAEVYQSGHANLWVMPIGSAKQGLDPADLSRNKLVSLFDTMRSRFDAIIIDTGPILTSVEACLVVGESDRVVMVLGRNQRADVIRSSLHRLDLAGAVCTGVVFNRSAEVDVKTREAGAPSTFSHVAPLVPESTMAHVHERAGVAFVMGRQSIIQPEAPSMRKRAA